MNVEVCDLWVYVEDFPGRIPVMFALQRFRFMFAFGASLMAGNCLGAVDAEVYAASLKPVLQARCVACHGALKRKGGLRLDTAELLRQGGEDGPVIVPGDARTGELLRRVLSTDESERMPPEGERLTVGQIESLKQWIAAGAPVPENEQPEPDPRDHWAFRPIVKPPLPDASFTGNPIDAFIAAKHAERGIRPQPEAGRSVLLRRAALDLTGLPPTRDELSAFRADVSARAYERLIDRLLASPHHGERWGRHWMDVWRYSDWFGLGKQLRNSQKHIWHWRDWIVESLNEDKGYDRMILEMLAGDEVEPTDRKTLRATGYLARNYYLFNRDTWLDETVEHTAKAFLGLTMNCVKCHDHKYDPFEVQDYYAFRAFFEPHQIRLDQEPGVMDFERDGLPRAFDDHLDAPTYVYRKGNDKDPDKSRVIKPALPVLFAAHEFSIDPVELPAFAYAPGSRDYVQKDHLAKAEADVAKAESELAKARQRLAAIGKEQAGKGGVEAAAEPVGPTPFLKDDFSKARSDLWEVSGEGWKHEDGKLLQTKPGTDRYLRSRKAHPENFRAVFRYKPTGGVKWKSMSMRFDVVDGGKTSHTAYLSALTPGSKAQISHTENGRNDYPAAGRKAMPVKLNEVHELEIAVRGHTINFWVDGGLALAYRLPWRRPGGRFELSVFDLTAELLSLEVESLPEQVELTQPDGASDMSNTLAGAKAGAALAERGVALAKENLAALKARIAADRAMVANPDSKEAGELAAAAAKTTRKAALAKADHDLARADQELARLSALAKPDKKKLAEAEKKLKAARSGRAKTLEALKKTDREYVSLTGSLKALETPAHKFGQYPPVYGRTSSGRRTALAKWMGSRENPLTARVAVNHIWMRHFGEPLVDNVFDFGRRAKEPEHLDLLNYLAADFMEHGWSMKRLHKLMMTSEAYRRFSSNADADTRAKSADPDNRLYWRMNPRRMESQIIRDSVLRLAGELQLQLGGPSVDPAKKDVTSRRSLYFTHSRDGVEAFLKSFDDAEITQCYRRSESVVPLQALAMANAEISIDMAGKIARGIVAEDDGSVVTGAFETVLARAPSEEERGEGVRFLGNMRELLKSKGVADREQRARARLVHALLNHNDFITIR